MGNPFARKAHGFALAHTIHIPNSNKKVVLAFNLNNLIAVIFVFIYYSFNFSGYC